jgi:hypothetical protein
MAMRAGPLVFSALLFALVAGMVWMATDFSEEARRIPLVVGVPTVALLGMQLVRDARNVAKEPDEQPGDQEPSHSRSDLTIQDGAKATSSGVRAGWAFVTVLGLAVIFWVFGLLVAVPLFSALFTWLYGRERWFLTIGVALATWAIIYFCFVILLELPVYDGLLWDLF